MRTRNEPSFLFRWWRLRSCFWQGRGSSRCLWAGFAVGLLVSRIPHLSLLYINVTYSQMLMMPVRHFYPWGHLLYGLAASLGVFLADRLRRLLTCGFRLSITSSLAEAGRDGTEWRWPGWTPRRVDGLRPGFLSSSPEATGC